MFFRSPFATAECSNSSEELDDGLTGAPAPFFVPALGLKNMRKTTTTKNLFCSAAVMFQNTSAQQTAFSADGIYIFFFFKDSFPVFPETHLGMHQCITYLADQHFATVTSIHRFMRRKSFSPTLKS